MAFFLLFGEQPAAYLWIVNLTSSSSSSSSYSSSSYYYYYYYLPIRVFHISFGRWSFTGLWVTVLLLLLLSLLLFISWEFLTSVLSDGLSLEFEWPQVSSSHQDPFSILAILDSAVVWLLNCLWVFHTSISVCWWLFNGIQITSDPKPPELFSVFWSMFEKSPVDMRRLAVTHTLLSDDYINQYYYQVYFWFLSIIYRVFTQDLAWGKVVITYILYIGVFSCLFWMTFFKRINSTFLKRWAVL